MQKILRIFSKIPEDAKTVLFIGTIKNCLGNIDDIFNIADELIAIKRHCIDNNHKINFVLIPEDIDNNDIETIRKILKKIVEKFCRTSDGGINKAMVKKLDKNICIKLYNQDYDINNIFKAIMNSFKNIEYDFIIQNNHFLFCKF